MKKLLALFCMLTCLFGLTACGGKEGYTEFEQQKLDYAKQAAAQQFIPFLSQFADDVRAGAFDENTAEEIEYVLAQQSQLNVDGNAFKSAVSSFHSTMQEIGAITDVGEATAEFDGSTIVVNVDVTCEKGKATAEVILSNDIFLELESAALNKVSGIGELMGKAALNTLIGMGTVFIVLILISLIISALGIIPKLQAKAEAKKKAALPAAPVPEIPAAVPAEPEVQESDDLELAAVIAAAIAASQGAQTTDGFVVRSIRRAGKR